MQDSIIKEVKKSTPEEEQYKDARNNAEVKWHEVLADPTSYLKNFAEPADNRPDGIVFVAGGGVAELLGDDESKTWGKLKAQAEQNDDTVEINGIEFTISELELMGEFYRWLKQAGHCIDERLDEGHPNAKSKVHFDCGLAAAASGAVKGTGEQLEDEAIDILRCEVKQPLLDYLTKNHFSLTVLIDTGNGHLAVREDKRQEMHDANALPFNVSLPLDRIANFLQEKQYEERADELMGALYKWNVQMAINIIYGHNAYKKQAEKDGMIIVVNRGHDDKQEALNNALDQNLQGSQDKHQARIMELP